MSLEEKIEIIESHLNKYGCAEITIEEYLDLKDGIFKAGCLAGVELGIKKAIDELTDKINKLTTYWIGDKDGHRIGHIMVVMAEVMEAIDQIKEKNNA